MAAVGLIAAIALSACQAGAPTRPALTFAPDVLPNGQVGKRYDQRIDIGGNVTPVFLYSIQSGQLPAGLAIEKLGDADNAGHIVGIPTTAGTSNFEIFVACVGTNVNGQTGTGRYTLTIT